MKAKLTARDIELMELHKCLAEEPTICATVGYDSYPTSSVERCRRQAIRRIERIGEEEHAARVKAAKNNLI